MASSSYGGGGGGGGGGGAGQKRPREGDATESDVPTTSGVQEHTLFFGNLAHSTTEYQLMQLCRKHGKLVRIDFMWHQSGPKRGLPRGYAFVEYSDRTTAAEARAALDGTIVNERPLSVRFSTDKVVFTDGVGALQRDGGGGGKARGGGPPLAKDREYRTIEESREIKTTQSVGVGRSAEEALKTTETVVDSKIAAIRAQLEAMKRAKAAGGGGAPTAK